MINTLRNYNNKKHPCTATNNVGVRPNTSPVWPAQEHSKIIVSH
nr:MAG TPA: hypothetical protein [Caudoviricetes sp.]